MARAAAAGGAGGGGDAGVGGGHGTVLLSYEGDRFRRGHRVPGCVREADAFHRGPEPGGDVNPLAVLDHPWDVSVAASGHPCGRSRSGAGA